MKANLARALLMARLLSGCDIDDELPPIPRGKPKGYWDHIPKSKRKGKTPKEIQAMRYGEAPDRREE